MDSRKNSNAVIIIINHQHLWINIAMVTSPRYTNMSRRGTSRCKQTTAFWWAVFAAWPSLVTRCSDEVALSHVWKSVEATTTTCAQVLSALENGKLSSWGLSHLRDIARLTRLWKPPSNCRCSIWAILAWFLRNSLKSVSRGELAKRIFSHYLPVFTPRSAWSVEWKGRVADQPCFWHALPLAQHLSHKPVCKNLCKTQDVDIITKRNTFGVFLSCFLYHHF